ncbi:hypothetical protein ThrDRAFT_02414 [Frankia casuarinae]|jgi:hypothetical protein|nr:hypothetical protein [Frankia casuarinae]ETA01524.1 hypothetical protein CcI6DRAFT_02999 [Frankia sp. CcI6]KDA42678.1 hypothetical protein BMG523Draft_02518 [Frankia sp. BMG5.23]KEZ35529.1 hypothetical protein CEDDRAFT_03079 [Frankia sp. CeD]KFB04545.1 hypothetical protein ALLO2DRAFT_02663 [Frankia sp. Allo2]EYT91895.1 hypothetical protein ThrDRAFT_02414 [Frankia casuarinae]
MISQIMPSHLTSPVTQAAADEATAAASGTIPLLWTAKTGSLGQ